MSIQELRERRNKLAHDMVALSAKEDWDPASDQATWDKMDADIQDLDARIKRISDANARLADETRTDAVAEAAARQGRNRGDKGLSIYAKWLKGGDRALNEDDWAHVRNTMSTTTGSEGGFTVDTEVAGTVINALKEFGGMRAVATSVQTSGVGLLSFPTSNGTAEKGEWVAENASATDLDVAFGTVGLPVYKAGSKVVTVPIELLSDSSIDVEAFVNARLIERLGRIGNEGFTIGSGTGQPTGIVPAATVGVTAANGSSQVTAVTYDSLVNLQHSVDPAYRGAAGWMFNDTTLRELRKIKDSQGRPIFAPGYETGNPGGSPDRLLGAPVTINQDMANMAASARSILFGDFSGYYIRDVMALQLFRFTDSAFTKKGQVGFLAWMRSGGNLIDANKVRVFVNAAS